MTESLELSFHPATPKRWADLEALFGTSGADSGCWCMFWRQTNAQAANLTPDDKKSLLKGKVDAELPTGMLAYFGERAVGWCGVSPRASFVRLEHTRQFQNPTTDKPTWTIVCLFVDKDARGQGVAVRLLQAAVRYALDNGAQAIESYPIKADKPLPAKTAFAGTGDMFLKAGFKEIVETTAKSRTGGFFRSIVRYDA